MSHWVASDLDTEVLRAHNGARLEQLGVEIVEQNAFDLHTTRWANEPNLVVMSCMCPPIASKSYLQRLLKIYNKWEPSGMDARCYYSAILFEAVVGQLPGSTVVSICRAIDYMVPGSVPQVVSPMRSVPGYKPKACNHAAGADLHELQGGASLRMRFNLDGCLAPTSLAFASSAIDLVDMCAAAEAHQVNVIFLGEWDGALCAACKEACRTPRMSTTFGPSRQRTSADAPVRELGRSKGDFSAFREHAEERRCEELLREWGDAVRDGHCEQEPVPPRGLEPHVGINAAVMWFFARTP